MLKRRTEGKWFFAMLTFLICYCIFLFVFRTMLVKVEAKYHVDIYKPERVMVFVVTLLILLYHFCFAGLYFFSQGSQWQKFAAVAVAVFVTCGLLYGFREWYRVTSEPLFLFIPDENFPWYAKEKTKFLITNAPLILFILTVFVLRIMMMFQKDNALGS